MDNHRQPQHRAVNPPEAGRALALVGALPERKPRGLACDQLHLEMFRSFLALLPLLHSQLKPSSRGQREDLTPEYSSCPLQLLFRAGSGYESQTPLDFGQENHSQRDFEAQLQVQGLSTTLLLGCGLGWFFFFSHYPFGLRVPITPCHSFFL